MQLLAFLDIWANPFLAASTATAEESNGFALHPIFVHFPIALLLVGSATLVWELIARWRTAPTSIDETANPTPSLIYNLNIFATTTLVLGYAGLIATIGAGLADLLGSPRNQARDGWVVIAVIHLSAGFGLMLVYGILLYGRMFNNTPSSEVSSRFDWLTTLLVSFGIILLIVTGWFGGELVYSYRIGIS